MNAALKGQNVNGASHLVDLGCVLAQLFLAFTKSNFFVVLLIIECFIMVKTSRLMNLHIFRHSVFSEASKKSEESTDF